MAALNKGWNGTIGGGGWSFEDLKNMGISPEEITGQKAIQQGQFPATKNVPALRQNTQSIPVGDSPVVTEAKPARPARLRLPLNKRAGLPSTEVRPNFSMGIDSSEPPLTNPRKATSNLPAISNSPIIEGEFTDMSSRPTAATFSQQFGGKGGAHPIDPTGGAVGALYRAASRATTDTDPLGNTTRLTIPGIEQMVGGYKDDATFKAARGLVKDAFANKHGIKSHDNINDPKEIFKQAPANETIAPFDMSGYDDKKAKWITDNKASEKSKYGFASSPDGGASMFGNPLRYKTPTTTVGNKTSASNDWSSGSVNVRALERNAKYNDEVAAARRSEDIDRNRENNKSIAERIVDLQRGNSTWSMKPAEMAKLATDDFDAAQKRGALSVTDATARRGQDETSEWRKQQSADTLEGRKFTAHENRLGREHLSQEGALNRKESEAARIAAQKDKASQDNATRITEARLKAQQAAEKLYPDDPIRQQESIMQSQSLINPELYDYDPPVPEVKPSGQLFWKKPGTPRIPGALRPKTVQAQTAQTATNPTTGERMVLKNGKWEKV